MKIISPIKTFIDNYTTLFDRMLLYCIGFGVIGSLILFTLNSLDFHYTTVSFVSSDATVFSWLQSVCVFTLGSVFVFYGLYIREESPRSSTFLWGIGLLFWCAFVNIMLANALQATPFSPIDHTLAKMDHWLGINTPALMAWTHNHPKLNHVFNVVYSSLVFELLLIPIFLAIFNGRKSLSIFFLAQFIAFFIGCFIYYFFPTMAPSGIFNSPYFAQMQIDTSMRFFQVHHYLKVTTNDGGLIAFPSFHVVWAILLSYACIDKKIFFYPIVCLNIVLISSTVFLGWHYFMDVICGAILASGSIVLAEWVYRKSLAETSNHI